MFQKNLRIRSVQFGNEFSLSSRFPVHCYLGCSETVEIKQVYKEADLNLRDLQRRAQQGYRTLQKCPDLFLPDCLEKITEEWLQQAIDAKLESVEQAGFLPDEEKKKLRGQWTMLQNFGGRAVRDIKELLNEVGSNNISWDEQLGIFITNIDALAHARAVRAVPNDAKEHHKKLCHILREVKELRDWEREHKIPTHPLADYAGMSLDFFAGAWVQGGMTSQQGVTDYGYLII